MSDRVTELTSFEQEMLDGAGGEAVALAMRLVMALAGALGAERLIEIERAHIDGCLYHGPVGLEFAERLVAGGARVRVPTTLNVASLDLIHPDLYRGDKSSAAAARRQMDAYVAMGCRPTWTCAPYQLADRPRLGEHIAWAESNAIVFANSVLGARTGRYGDFIDIAAAITGRVPAAGYHLDEERRAGLVFDVSPIPASARGTDFFFAVLGHLVGRAAGSQVPAIVGIDAAGEDQMKALGAAAASSGAIGLIHVVGVTPEAPALDAVAAHADLAVETISPDRLSAAEAELSTVRGGHLQSVNLGTPHASATELARLAEALDGGSVAPGVACYVNTSRDILGAAPAAVATLETAGVRIVTDTCTYITPILERSGGVHMTDSAKWAYYAPANLGVDVLFASTSDCVASALAGEVVRTGAVWDA